MTSEGFLQKKAQALQLLMNGISFIDVSKQTSFSPMDLHNWLRELVDYQANCACAGTDVQYLNKVLITAKKYDFNLTREKLLRKLIELEPENSEHAISLVKTLIKIFQKKSGKFQEARISPLLKEAEVLLLKEEKFNVTILSLLAAIKNMQQWRGPEIRYLERALEIEPDNMELQKRLSEANRVLRAFHQRRQQSQNQDDKPNNLESSFTTNDFEPAEFSDDSVGETFKALYDRLLQVLNGEWNQAIIIEILQLMLAEVSNNDELLKRIETIITQVTKGGASKQFLVRNTVLNLR